MKIEMGESLCLSWLRHVKKCQIVQTNWKPSPKWGDIQNKKEIERLMSLSKKYFESEHKYEIFKNNEYSQFLKQAEIDLLGVSLPGNERIVYAVDVAYHGGGLNYGGKEKTAIKIAKKIIRTAMCLRGYFNATKAEIIFASPKINPANTDLINPILTNVKELFIKSDLPFSVEIIANEKFNKCILKEVTKVSNDIADTSELFLRAYQLVKMFDTDTYVPSNTKSESTEPKTLNGAKGEQKIGKIVQTLLRDILESGKLSRLEIESMQEKEYSKQVFNINYPLLRHADTGHTRRYYAESKSLSIGGNKYYLCCEWFEKSRPFVMKWLGEHGGIPNSEGL